jgi:hypothetical protein
MKFFKFLVFGLFSITFVHDWAWKRKTWSDIIIVSRHYEISLWFINVTIVKVKCNCFPYKEMIAAIVSCYTADALHDSTVQRVIHLSHVVDRISLTPNMPNDSFMLPFTTIQSLLAQFQNDTRRHSYFPIRCMDLWVTFLPHSGRKPHKIQLPEISLKSINSVPVYQPICHSYYNQLSLPVAPAEIHRSQQLPFRHIFCVSSNDNATPSLHHNLHIDSRWLRASSFLPILTPANEDALRPGIRVCPHFVWSLRRRQPLED